MAGDKKELGIIIGRFQPFHLGHQALIAKALEYSSRVLVLVGSAGSGPGLRNPWTYEQRVEMMHASLAGLQVEFCGIKDSDYHFPDWREWIVEAVHGFEPDDGKVVLVGHSKDETSFYLEHFPRWSYQEIGIQEGGLGASALRDAYLSSGAGAVKARVPAPVAGFLSAWEGSDGFRWLRDEWLSWKSMRAHDSLTWPDGCLHEVLLMISAGNSCVLRLGDGHPGKGLFHLPGGFVPASMDPVEFAGGILSGSGLEELTKGGENQARTWEFRRVGDDGKGEVKVRVMVFRLKDHGYPVPGHFWFPHVELGSRACEFAGDHGRIIGHCLREGWIDGPKEGEQ